MGMDSEFLKQHLSIKTEREERAKELSQKGIPWSAKLFYDAPPTASQVSTLSGALRDLEKRGLVVGHDGARGLGEKPRTTHVKLTEPGKNTALSLKNNGANLSGK